MTYSVASGFAPGDTVEHTLDLQLTAHEPLATITLTTTSNDPSLLVTDRAHGLHVAIDTCVRPNADWWQEFGTSAAPSSSCVGTTAVVLVSRPILGTDIPLDNVNVDGVTHLRISVTLPATADNRFQGLTSIIHFVFHGQTERHDAAVHY